MTTTSRTATTRARGMAGTTGEDRTGGMDTGTTHTGSNNSITMTAMTRKDIRTMTICGDHFSLLTRKLLLQQYHAHHRGTETKTGEQRPLFT